MSGGLSAEWLCKAQVVRMGRTLQTQVERRLCSLVLLVGASEQRLQGLLKRFHTFTQL